MSGPAGPCPVTRNPLDWHPLAGADPVPGEPWSVHDLARTMALTAKVAQAQARALAAPGGLGWQGTAAEAFAGVAVELPPLLDRVAARYAGAAEALTAYAHALATAQERARAALVAARAPAPDLAAAARVLAEAVSERECAAVTAASRLTTVAQDGLRDQASLGRLLGRVVHAAADFAVNTAHLDEASAILGVGALLTVWCPPVAGTLQVGALATGAVALAARVELAASGSKGGSKEELVGSAVGVALLGVGRIYGASTRAGAAVANAERGVAAAGADAQRLAEAHAALAAARAQLPVGPLLPRAGHALDASPHRLVREVKASWQQLGTPGATLTSAAQQAGRETADALTGRYGAAVATNSAVRVGVGVEGAREDLLDLREGPRI